MKFFVLLTNDNNNSWRNFYITDDSLAIALSSAEIKQKKPWMWEICVDVEWETKFPTSKCPGKLLIQIDQEEHLVEMFAIFTLSCKTHKCIMLPPKTVSGSSYSVLDDFMSEHCV